MPPVDPTSPIAPPVRRPVRRRLAAAAAAGSIALAGVAGAGVVAADTDDPTGLRTAEVAHHRVVETLDLTGTVEPVAQASVAFPTDGTVATVEVAPGDEVEVGQVLATLDTADLADAVVAATEALAVAQLSLEQALAGETVTDAPSGSDGSTSGSNDPRQPTAVGIPILTAEVLPVATESSSESSGVTDEEIAAAQQAVLDAAAAADDALMAADASLALATDVCAALGSPDAGPTVAEDCHAALTQVVADQQAAAAALAVRGEAADALDALLAERAAEEPPVEEPPVEEPPPSSAPSTAPATGPETATDDGPNGSDPSDGATAEEPSGATDTPSSPSADEGSSPSAEELIAYQSDVDAAAAQLVVATQALDQATIVSPLAGTVASVGLAVGDVVTAGSSTATVIVVGEGGYEVSTTVAVDDLAELEVGQPATVAVDGSAAPITGEVVAIGLSSTEGDSGRTYPVTIGLTSSDDLRHGTLAELSIALATSTDAVSVPTSAVDLSGAQATVTVVDEAGEASAVPVVLGAVGGAYVEVTGVEVGDVVVLADLSEPLPEPDDPSSSGPGPSDEMQVPAGVVKMAPPR
ncbi:MAG TPA: HlyD family efflux transporter periplasmic adaptor subunit [Iamia sp.]|nr:HlyD family efflux transporter periplasmic adaptor subunit [Iamia sp.]